MFTNITLLKKEIMKNFKRLLVKPFQKRMFIKLIMEKDVNYDSIIFLIKLEKVKILVFTIYNCRLLSLK
jgi:hypothetical protein